ncbi:MULTISPECIES: ABC transporter substrate-binding protein [Megasphaera]|uniref:Oligopeptide ABC transporter, oligopeptide-binding protein n=1 Tax=Megasphaera vaginalis (ex Srinivasan et al. 2021) TaxID=1111454 RepID=U7UFV5_9FIRM|nr:MULTISPECIES: extracellular solute-binding protein [Megasphaera]ERT58176.1 oligopeptide ABC transporter, oligopeptide-binding protein [Megasphaera vaginalis (ex Srinivasan et al. 2021)]
MIKKQMPFVGIIFFVISVLALCAYVIEEQQAAKAAAAYEAERHLVVVSDLPDAVNRDLAAAFYEETKLRIQIRTESDDTIRRLLKDPNERIPDFVIASEETLYSEDGLQHLKASSSERAAAVPERFKAADGNWTGLWFDPLVFVVSRDYYARRGREINYWDDLLTDPQVVVAFPDLAATDLTGNFLFHFVSLRGQDNASLYFKTLQNHIGAYSTSLSPIILRVAGNDAQIGITDGAAARQYRNDGAPIYILYPQDGTAYWLTGAALTQWCADDELATAFMDWLLSSPVDGILQKNHLYLNYTTDALPAHVDSRGHSPVFFDMAQVVTEKERRQVQDWWIKTIRFGKGM